MKIFFTLAFFCITVAVVSCGPAYKVIKGQPNSNFHLASYPTYAFYQVDAKGDTSIKYERNLGYIKSAIARNLAARGLNEAQDAALKINIGLTVENKVQTRETDFRTDRAAYMGQRNYSWQSQEVVVGHYREGTMMIDFVSAAENKMVYQTGGEGILPEKKDMKEGIDKLVDDIFAKIPN